MDLTKNIAGILTLALLAFSSCTEQNNEIAQKSLEAKSPSDNNQLYAIVGEKHFIDGYPALNSDSLMHVIIEIPTGSTEKWEVEKGSGHLTLEKRNGELRKVNYLGYPGNYGMVPQTLLAAEEGGDGDPLDVLILGEPLERGALVGAKPIGVLKLLDRNEQDDKIIAVVEGSPFYEVDDLNEMDAKFKGVTLIIETWFDSYKGGNKIEIKGFGDKSEAQAILNAAIHGYKNK